MKKTSLSALDAILNDVTRLKTQLDSLSTVVHVNTLQDEEIEDISRAAKPPVLKLSTTYPIETLKTALNSLDDIHRLREILKANPIKTDTFFDEQLALQEARRKTYDTTPTKLPTKTQTLNFDVIESYKNEETKQMLTAENNDPATEAELIRRLRMRNL